MAMAKEKTRVARSNVVLDVDDVIILITLADHKPEMFLHELQKIMNFSRKSILIHLARLHAYHLINYERGKDENYKYKMIGISSLGMGILHEFLKCGIIGIDHSSKKMFVSVLRKKNDSQK